MSTYNPDKWLLVRIEHEGRSVNKILAGWSGGYLDADSWRISSKVEYAEEDGDYYLVHNYSGSVYKCHKNSEGTTGMSGMILDKMKKAAKVDILNIKDVFKGKEIVMESENVVELTKSLESAYEIISEYRDEMISQGWSTNKLDEWLDKAEELLND